MNEAKHAAGPWECRPAGEFFTILGGYEHRQEYPAHVVRVSVDDEGRRRTEFVCSCASTTLPNDANAHLIAAAPELLEALKAILAPYCEHLRGVRANPDEAENVIAARLAIAKAEDRA